MERKCAIRLRECSEMYRVYQESLKTVVQWCDKQGHSVKTFYYRVQKICESAQALELIERIFVADKGFEAMPENKSGIELLKPLLAEYWRLLDAIDAPKGSGIYKAVGRKNWLFSDTDKGTGASARCYSVIESAKANNLNVFGYLTQLLTELPKLGTEPTAEQLDALLPWSTDSPEYCRN